MNEQGEESTSRASTNASVAHGETRSVGTGHTRAQRELYLRFGL